MFEHARKQTGTAFGDHSAHSKAGIDFDQSAFGSFRTRLRVEVLDLRSVYPVFFDSKKTGQTLDGVIPAVR